MHMLESIDMDPNEIVIVATRLIYLQTDYAKDDMIAIGHDPKYGLVQFAMDHFLLTQKMAS